MDSRQGTFIVIESSNPAHSEAVVDRLEQRLTAAGHTVLTYHFPRMHEEASYFIGKYAADEYGDQSNVSPYTASLLFALDRYDAAGSIRSGLAEGAVVLCSNYTGANMAKQGAKFDLPEERRGFYIWLDNLEYHMLGIPRPDTSLILLPSQNTDQARVYATLQELSQLFPKDFELILTDRSGTPIETTKLDDILWQKLVPLLPDPESKATQKQTPLKARPTRPQLMPLLQITDTAAKEFCELDPVAAIQNASFVVPAMRPDIIPSYTSGMERIIAGIGDLARVAGRKATSADEQSGLRLALLQLLPSGVHSKAINASSHTPSRSAVQADKTGIPHGDVKPVRLIGANPINELHILPWLLFGLGNDSWQAIAESVDTMPVAARYDSLQTLLSKSRALGSRVTYDFEVLIDQVSAAQLGCYGFELSRQTVTPRFGYAVPKIIDELQMGDAYEALFGQSLQLHSTLLRENEPVAAEYTTLLGHKAHYLVRLTYDQLQAVLSSRVTHTDQTAALLVAIRDLAREKHPTIFQS